MSRVNYYEYLRSPEWQVVRRLALERAAGRCQVCNQPGRLDVHHRTYARLGQELLSDVTVLCRDCHSKHHEKLPGGPVIQATQDDPYDGDPLPLGPSERDRQQRIADQTFGVSSFRPEDSVTHTSFGEGVVTGVESDGIVVIRFAKDGKERKLMAEFAPLTLLDQPARKAA